MNEITIKIQPLLKAQQELRRKRESGAKLISAITDYFESATDPMISEVMSDRKEIDMTLKALAERIDYIQSKCDHEFRYEGHDGHYSYHVCHICSLTDKL